MSTVVVNTLLVWSEQVLVLTAAGAVAARPSRIRKPGSGCGRCCC